MLSILLVLVFTYFLYVVHWWQIWNKDHFSNFVICISRQLKLLSKKHCSMFYLFYLTYQNGFTWCLILSGKELKKNPFKADVQLFRFFKIPVSKLQFLQVLQFLPAAKPTGHRIVRVVVVVAVLLLLLLGGFFHLSKLLHGVLFNGCVRVFFLIPIFWCVHLDHTLI